MAEQQKPSEQEKPSLLYALARLPIEIAKPIGRLLVEHPFQTPFALLGFGAAAAVCLTAIGAAAAFVIGVPLAAAGLVQPASLAGPFLVAGFASFGGIAVIGLAEQSMEWMQERHQEIMYKRQVEARQKEYAAKLKPKVGQAPAAEEKPGILHKLSLRNIFGDKAARANDAAAGPKAAPGGKPAAAPKNG